MKTDHGNQRRLERLSINHREDAALEELARRDPATLDIKQRLAVGHYLKAKDAHRQVNSQQNRREQ